MLPKRQHVDIQNSCRAQVLLPREQITLSGAIMSRSTIFSKRRFLILTDYPRLLVCRVHKARVKIKHEILFGIDTPQPEYAPAGGAAYATGHVRNKSKNLKDEEGTTLQTFVTVVEDNLKVFRVATVSCLREAESTPSPDHIRRQNLRAFRFEDATGNLSSNRWVSAIRQAHKASFSINQQMHDRSPEGGVPLPPLSVTSSGSSGPRQLARGRSHTPG